MCTSNDCEIRIVSCEPHPQAWNAVKKWNQQKSSQRAKFLGCDVWATRRLTLFALAQEFRALHAQPSAGRQAGIFLAASGPLAFCTPRQIDEVRGSAPLGERRFWPAPGSKDTELGVLMELEVGHGE